MLRVAFLCASAVVHLTLLVLLHTVCRAMLPEVHETLCKGGCALCGAHKCSRAADAASHESEVGNYWCACQHANDEL